MFLPPVFSGFEPVSHDLAEILRRHGIDQPVPDVPLRLAQHSSSVPAILQYLQRFVPPEKLDVDRISLSGLSSGSRTSEKATFRPDHSAIVPPPCGHVPENFFYVGIPGNQGDPIEDPVVQPPLGRKAHQGILIAFDLISDQSIVDNGEVDSAYSLAQPELVDDQRIGMFPAGPFDVFTESFPDAGIVHSASTAKNRSDPSWDIHDRTQRIHETKTLPWTWKLFSVVPLIHQESFLSLSI
jgi:hypothetical protein